MVMVSEVKKEDEIIELHDTIDGLLCEGEIEYDLYIAEVIPLEYDEDSPTSGFYLRISIDVDSGSISDILCGIAERFIVIEGDNGMYNIVLGVSQEDCFMLDCTNQRYERVLLEQIYSVEIYGRYWEWGI